MLQVSGVILEAGVGVTQEARVAGVTQAVGVAMVGVALVVFSNRLSLQRYWIYVL